MVVPRVCVLVPAAPQWSPLSCIFLILFKPGLEEDARVIISLGSKNTFWDGWFNRPNKEGMNANLFELGLRSRQVI